MPNDLAILQETRDIAAANRNERLLNKTKCHEELEAIKLDIQNLNNRLRNVKVQHDTYLDGARTLKRQFLGEEMPQCAIDKLSLHQSRIEVLETTIGEIQG